MSLIQRLDRSGPVAELRDRCYWPLTTPQATLHDLDRTGTFAPAPSKLHKPHEPGWECVGSWKSVGRQPVLQVTLWRKDISGVGKDGAWRDFPTKHVAEIDLDIYKRLLRHFFGEVIPNVISGNRTHPYVICQLLSWFWGVVPFRLEAGA